MEKQYFTKDGRKILYFWRRNGNTYYKTEDGELKKDENIGYHYGDLGKARDTNYFSMSSSRRSTGHFGTGTYFISKQNPGNARKDRPEHKIDFKNYKLFKPKTEEQAYILHEGLKSINNEEFSEKNMQDLRGVLKKSNIEVGSAYHNTIKQSKINEKMNVDDKLKQDSLSTTFMKSLGYEGIDVRHLEKYDTMEYGSVIYDLKKKK